jgi:Tfp pilus assembly protein PilZ
MTPPDKGAERRRFPRAHESFGVQYRLSGQLGTSWATATMINISAGGLRIRHSELLETGTVLSLQLKLPGASETLMLQGQVVWTALQASGVNEYGVEFMGVSLQQQTTIDQLVSFLRTRV